MQIVRRLVHEANELVRPVDRALFAPRTTGDPPRPVFIVGPARSGTTLLFQALAHAGEVGYLPQALDYAYGASNLVFRAFSSRLSGHPASFGSRYGRTAGPFGPSEAFGFWRRWFWKGSAGDHRHGQPLPRPRADQLAKVVGEISAHGGRPLLVKCLYLSMAIPAIADAMPGARFIFVTRDALETARSSLRAKLNGGHPTSWWSTRPPGFGEHLAESPEDQVLWQMAAVARTVASDLSALPPDRWVRVRYEALCANPCKVLAEITGKLGLGLRQSNSLPERFEAADRFAIDPAINARLQASRYFPAAHEVLR